MLFHPSRSLRTRCARCPAVLQSPLRLGPGFSSAVSLGSTFDSRSGYFFLHHLSFVREAQSLFFCFWTPRWRVATGFSSSFFSIGPGGTQMLHVTVVSLALDQLIYPFVEYAFVPWFISIVFVVRQCVHQKFNRGKWVFENMYEAWFQEVIYHTARH
jgi:hypothetical protein